MAIDQYSYNLGVKHAQSVLRLLAKGMPQEVEVGYHQMNPNPKAVAYREAAAAIGDLIEPEQETP